ncbi:UPF0764 protein C16orf89 homolog [Liolophura sinensis]|uniref:UPF0764 protein C16orf89 homolog n=1 Tax=Liolophura sinensis TaxID=3198878 RepID=UPI00315855BE
MAAIHVILVLLAVFQGGSLQRTYSEASTQELLESVFVAIEKLSAFFKSDYSQVNVDGLFGLRLGQGQLIAALKEGGDLTYDLASRLEALEEEVEFTCQQVLPYVEARDEEYFKRFRLTVEDPYMLPYTPIDLHPPATNRTITDTTSYNEEAGDICLSKIMGTFVHDDVPVPVCTSDEDCFQMMTKQGTTGYTLTHQLLYFILGHKMDCERELQDVAGQEVDIADIEARMCEEIYQDALQLIQDGDVPSGDQDLFMEQISLCGVLGFQNFMRSDWMKMVLKWPSSEGCFTLQLTPQQENVARQMRSLMSGLKKKVDRQRAERSCDQPNPPTGRKLLREFPMRDGCMAHKSGLGFSTLATYLRHLLMSVPRNK